MSTTVMPYVKGQEIEVRFNGAWRRAIVHRTYELGLDAIVGSAGCWYFSLADTREAVA